DEGRRLAFDALVRGQRGCHRGRLAVRGGRRGGPPVWVARGRPMSSALLHSLTGQRVRAGEEARMAVPEVASRRRWPGAGLALLAGEKEPGGAGLCPGTPAYPSALGVLRG